MKKHSITLVVVLVVSLTSTNAQAPTSSPEPTRGQRIGEVVKEAIEKAIPGVGTLVDLIWSKHRENRKMAKEDLAKATEVAHEEIRKQIIDAAKEQIEPVKGVASRLRVVNLFLEPAIQANETVARIQTTLGATREEAKINWVQLQDDWEVAKKHLQQIEKIPTDQINSVQDPWIRDKLQKIVKLNSDPVIRISRIVGRKSPSEIPSLCEHLDDVQSTLRHIGAVAGITIVDLGSDVSNLAAWAASKTPPGEAYGKATVYEAMLEIELGEM